MRRLAVISRNAALAERLGAEFEAIHVSPEHCTDGEHGFAPDAYLVDASDYDRLELVARLAQRTRRPIVVMGADEPPARASDYLETGADAYLRRSDSTAECVARIRAITRRATLNSPLREPEDYRAGDVAIMRDSHRVVVRSEEVRLTRTEFTLLLALAERMDEIVPHRKLMADVWGPEYLSARHYLRVYIHRLREKLEADPEHPVLLVAERGKGYMLRSSAAPRPAEA